MLTSTFEPDLLMRRAGAGRKPTPDSARLDRLLPAGPALNDPGDGLSPKSGRVGELPERGSCAMSDSNHVVSDLDLARRALGAQADNDQRGANFTGVVASVLLHRGGRG
jgi:hypothetical protein